MILEAEGPFIILHPFTKGIHLELIVGSWHISGHLFLGDCLVEEYFHFCTETLSAEDSMNSVILQLSYLISCVYVLQFLS